MNSMVSVLLCTSSSGGMVNSASAVAAVGAAELPWRGLDGGEERSVQDELEMAKLRKQAGEKA